MNRSKISNMSESFRSTLEKVAKMQIIWTNFHQSIKKLNFINDFTKIFNQLKINSIYFYHHNSGTGWPNFNIM